jgi:hypothetical protein
MRCRSVRESQIFLEPGFVVFSSTRPYPTNFYYEINDKYRGKTMDELEAIATEIQEGRSYKFVEEEVRSVIAYAHQVMAISVWRLIIDGLKWIGPPLRSCYSSIFCCS